MQFCFVVVVSVYGNHFRECRFTKSFANAGRPHESPAGNTLCVNSHFKVNGMQNEGVEIIPGSINI